MDIQMSALSQMSAVVIHCPDITSVPCKNRLMDALFSSATGSLYLLQSHFKQGMVPVEHSPLSLVQDQDYEALLAGTSSFLHPFNMVACIYYSHYVEQRQLSNEGNTRIFKHQADKCAGFDNCRILDDFLLSLTLLSLKIEFHTNVLGFSLEPSLGLPNGNQYRLCSTADFVTKINSRNNARSNSYCGFPKVLENIRPCVFNTPSLVIDCKIEDAKE